MAVLTEAEVAELQKRVEFLEKENETLKTFVKESDEKITNLTESLKTYEEFCTVEEFKDIEENLSLVVSYSELGTVESVKESLAVLSAYESVGTVEEITESLTMLNSYKESATLDEIDESVKTIEAYVALGSIEDISSKMESLKGFESAGMTVEQISAMVESQKAEEAKKVVCQLASECSVSESVASKTLELHGQNFESAKEYLVELKGIKVEAKESEDKSLVGATVESVVNKVNENQAPAKKATMLGNF